MPLLASADVAKGQAFVQEQCAACHTFTQGGANGVGPNLYGVLGGPMFAKAGFTYSDAAKAKAKGNWDYEKMNAWLADPADSSRAPPCPMPGIKNTQTRADVIAYLRTLAATPLPLPSAAQVKAASAPAAAAPAGGTGGAPSGIAPLFAHADLAKGQALVQEQCAACHSFTKGGPTIVGPNLYGIVGAKMFSHARLRLFRRRQSQGRRHLDRSDDERLAGEPDGLCTRHDDGLSGHQERPDEGRCDRLPEQKFRLPDQTPRPMSIAWLEGVTAALDAAGAVIRPYFRAGVTAEQKTDESPVTIADRRAEETLRGNSRRSAFPISGSSARNSRRITTGARHVWVIDPIDGTRAFITGRTSFCTLVGLLEDGVPVFGVIDQPVTGERWVGGGGVARFTGPFGGKMGTRAIYRHRPGGTLLHLAGNVRPASAAHRQLKSLCRRIYWGGDAYAYGLLALGQIDIVVECNLKPWDWAALAPVIEAAGGVVTDWAGAKLRLGSDGSVLAAANPALHAAALAALG